MKKELRGTEKDQGLGAPAVALMSTCRCGSGSGDDKWPVGPRRILRREKRKHIRAESERYAHWTVGQRSLKH